MRILWVSNSPNEKSGYGKQSAFAIAALLDLGHEVAVQSNFMSRTWEIDFLGCPIIAPLQGQLPLGGLLQTARSFKPDLIIFLMDVWAYPIEMFQELHTAGFKMLNWCVIDSDPLSMEDVKRFNWCDWLCPMSPHGEKMLRTHPDIEEDSIALTLPHVFDPAIFNRDPKEDPLDSSVDDDTIVVGMVQANIGNRKQIVNQLLGLKDWRDMYMDPEKHLLVVWVGDPTGATTIGPWGVDYTPLLREFDLDWDAVRGISDDRLAQYYTRFDLLLHVTGGESFGVPIAEAQACGTPVVTARNSASMHTNKVAFHQVPTSMSEWVIQLNTWHTICHPEDIALGVENAHGSSLTNLDPVHWPDLSEYTPQHLKDQFAALLVEQ